MRQYITRPKAHRSVFFKASCDIGFVGFKYASGAVKRGLKACTEPELLKISRCEHFPGFHLRNADLTQVHYQVLSHDVRYRFHEDSINHWRYLGPCATVNALVERSRVLHQRNGLDHLGMLPYF